jgi:predicted TIM-barrel fold metal-dependent hydrolase
MGDSKLDFRPFGRLTRLYNAFKRLSTGYSAAERAAMFHDTATRVYRIDV